MALPEKLPSTVLQVRSIGCVPHVPTLQVQRQLAPDRKAEVAYPAAGATHALHTPPEFVVHDAVTPPAEQDVHMPKNLLVEKERVNVQVPTPLP